VRIRVTLEKPDILRLVFAHLKVSGLNPLDGQDIKYKGALEVELFVEVGESTSVPPSLSATPTTPTKKDAPVDDGRSVEDVVAESARIQKVRDEENKLKRKLAPNEFTEFPRGGH
jgi:hypothetical protein